MPKSDDPWVLALVIGPVVLCSAVLVIGSVWFMKRRNCFPLSQRSPLLVVSCHIFACLHLIITTLLEGNGPITQSCSGDIFLSLTVHYAILGLLISRMWRVYCRGALAQHRLDFFHESSELLGGHQLAKRSRATCSLSVNPAAPSPCADSPDIGYPRVMTPSGDGALIYGHVLNTSKTVSWVTKHPQLFNENVLFVCSLAGSSIFIGAVTLIGLAPSQDGPTTTCTDKMSVFLCYMISHISIFVVLCVLAYRVLQVEENMGIVTEFRGWCYLFSIGLTYMFSFTAAQLLDISVIRISYTIFMIAGYCIVSVIMPIRASYMKVDDEISKSRAHGDSETKNSPMGKQTPLDLTRHVDGQLGQLVSRHDALLNRIMQDRELLEMLRKHMAREFSLENLAFIERERSFRNYVSKLPQPLDAVHTRQIERRAIQIYELFIASGASLELNLPSFLRNELVIFFKPRITPTKTVAVHPELAPIQTEWETLFHRAYQCVHELITASILPRFLHSPAVIDYKAKF